MPHVPPLNNCETFTGTDWHNVFDPLYRNSVPGSRARSRLRMDGVVQLLQLTDCCFGKSLSEGGRGRRAHAAEQERGRRR